MGLEARHEEQNIDTVRYKERWEGCMGGALFGVPFWKSDWNVLVMSESAVCKCLMLVAGYNANTIRNFSK